MSFFAHLSRLLPAARSVNRRSAPQPRMTLKVLEVLEERAHPSASPIDLGAASHFAVLGMPSTIMNNDAAIVGNVGVSRLGTFVSGSHSSIDGDVDRHLLGVYLGGTPAGGHVVVDSTLLNQADNDALNASAAAKALVPTQTFQNIASATTITGSGGLNVIKVSGDITGSLVLNGTANDVFIVNVTGSLRLQGTTSLALAGGVTADHVIYNFVGSFSQVSAGAGNVVNGTILAPKSSVSLNGTQVNGEVIGGGLNLNLGRGAAVTQLAFNGTTSSANASLSGFAFVDYNSNGMIDSGENGYSGMTVTLSGVDDQGHSVSYTADTDENGFYAFTGLRAGTYSLTFSTPPSGGTAVTGSTDGYADGSVQDSSTISGIVLTSTSQGSNYNYAVATQS